MIKYQPTETTQLFTPIINEAQEKYPGWNLLTQLDNYINLYVQIYTYNQDSAIKEKALRKTVIASNLRSYFLEGRN